MKAEIEQEPIEPGKLPRRQWVRFNSRIAVMLTPAQKEEIRKISRKMGQTMSSYLISLAFRDISNRSPASAEQEATVTLKFFKFGPDLDVLARLNAITERTGLSLEHRVPSASMC